MFKKVFFSLFILLLILIGALIFNTLRFKSTQKSYELIEQMNIPSNSKVKLSDALKIKTISHENYNEVDTAAFIQFHQFLEDNFSLVHQHLRKVVVNELSLIYHWKGKNSSVANAMLAHIDVVPAEDAKDWDFDPYSGDIADGEIRGRGALDVKGSLIAILEAVELLLTQNFQPATDFYFAFGQDEENGGRYGAVEIVQWFQQQNVKFDFVLDEGLIITNGIMPGIDGPLAMIGLAEKGYGSIKLQYNTTGGHSSMPPAQTAIDVLANAVKTINENPMPQSLDGPIKQLFEAIAPEMSFANRLVFANQWLFGGIVKNQLGKSRSTNAATRTTLAATIMQSGNKTNIIPASAMVNFNARIIPGETVEDVEHHFKSLIKDENITIEMGEDALNPSNISTSQSAAYTAIEKTIHQIFDNTLVAPSLLIGGTDSRYYEPIAKNVYRFLPVSLNNEELETIHGKNEKIGIDDFENMIRFYAQLIRNVE